MLRLFVAIDLPEDHKRSLQGRSNGLAGARWVDPAGLHLTLRFIGEVHEDAAEDLDAALCDIRAPAFDLDIRRPGVFERKGRAHTLWAGVVPNPALDHLQGKVTSVVVRSGLGQDDRKFAPHITLARLKDCHDHRVRDWLTLNEDLALPTFTVDRFVMMQSHLGHNGPRYQVIADYPLLATPGASHHP